MMDAIVQTAPEPKSVEVRQVDEPTLGSDEVLVDVHTSGVCGSDAGAYLFKGGYEWVPTPRVMGHEYSGVVLEVGENVVEFMPGDKVVEQPVRNCGRCRPCKSGLYNVCENFEITGMHHDGSWTDRIAVPASSLHHVPDTLDLHIAAIAEPLSVATRTVIDNSRVRAGSNVLIEGPGPIGLLCAQVASISGGEVLVSGLENDTEFRLPLADKMGFETTVTAADKGVDPGETIGRKFDVVIDATGHANGIHEGLEHVRKGGQIVVVGLPSESSEIFVTDAVRSEIDIQCSYASLWQNFEQALTLLDQDKIETADFIDNRFNRNDPKAALDAFIDGKTVKPVFDFSS